MKTLFKYVLGTFFLASLSSCANGQKLQEKAPVELQQVYYNVHLAQDDSNAARYNLFIPTSGFNKMEVQLDSVYFRSRKAALSPTGNQPNLYVAHFEFPGKDRELVMHADPKEEFGNTAPVLVKTPFDLKADEAVLVFTKNGSKGYYKIKGISERGTAEETIKKP